MLYELPQKSWLIHRYVFGIIYATVQRFYGILLRIINELIMFIFWVYIYLLNILSLYFVSFQKQKLNIIC